MADARKLSGVPTMGALLVLVAVHDKRADTYSALHLERADASAVRNFGEAVLSADSMMRKYPEDFDLVKVGTFDDCSGEVYPCGRVVLASAADVVRRAVRDVPDSPILPAGEGLSEAVRSIDAR